MKKIKSKDAIYEAIEQAMKATVGPKTCASLMDDTAVRTEALKRYADGKSDASSIQLATNKLSDALGFMWRRGIIKRHPAPNEASGARYAYSWPEEITDEVDTTVIPPPIRLVASTRKPVFTITESDEETTIEFERITLIIRSK